VDRGVAIYVSSVGVSFTAHKAARNRSPLIPEDYTTQQVAEANDSYLLHFGGRVGITSWSGKESSLI
jgi:ribose 5-phosphate isomerase RpiB